MGTAVSLQIVATDSLGKPMSFTATGLPTSLSMSASGRITGTPNSAGTYSVTVTAHSDATFGTHTFTWKVGGYGTGVIVNGGFETGSLTSGWSAAGTTGVTTSGPHSGTYAAMLGSTSPSATSSISQTVIVPSGTTKLGFYYDVVCPDSVNFDWATATVKDNTTGVTTTALAKTCVANSGWVRVAVPVTVGDSYTLTLVNQDDGHAGDATYTKYDDVAFS